MKSLPNSADRQGTKVNTEGTHSEYHQETEGFNYSRVSVIDWKSNVTLRACCKRSIPKLPKKNLLESIVGLSKTPVALSVTGNPPMLNFNDLRFTASMYFAPPIPSIL